jgi:aspartate/methionine/tyrosine aminotransferase
MPVACRYPDGMAGRFSARALSLTPFLAMEVMERAFEMEAEGARVLHLEVGEPDFSPPPAALRACAQALEAGETRYTDSRGLVELRRAISEDARRRHGVEVDPNRVLVTAGTSGAMLLVFLLLIESGDEVVMGTPHYPCYPNFVRACGGTPVFVPLAPEAGYALRTERVRAAITQRTRAIVVGSPANPTGAIQSEDDIRGLAELGLPLVSDEIYDGLVYEGGVFSAQRCDADEVFVLDGFSKRYAMTGFRLGWVVAPEDAVRPLKTLQQNLFISANRFVQHAGVAALADGESTVVAMCDAYRRRRDLLVRGLRDLGFYIPASPPGAFYVFADARAFGKDSRRLSLEILERAHVGVTPGVDFGEAGEGWLRMCFAASEETLREALERLARVLPELA